VVYCDCLPDGFWGSTWTWRERYAYLQDPSKLTEEQVFQSFYRAEAKGHLSTSDRLMLKWFPIAATALAHVPEAGLAELTAAKGTSSLAEDLVLAELHLASIHDALEYAHNKAMLDSIRNAQATGRSLSAAERTFLDHEILEAQLMRTGLSQEEAHQAVLKVYAPGSNYSPEVIKEFSEYFSDVYFKYWGISR
jgi:hypothetical protein